MVVSYTKKSIHIFLFPSLFSVFHGLYIYPFCYQKMAEQINKPVPHGFYGPPVPSHFISTQPQDSMQPLALVKRIPSSPSTAAATSHPTLIPVSASTSHHGHHLPPSSQQPHQGLPKEVLDSMLNPTVIVTTRTPIFIKSSPHISVVPRHTVMAHTQSTQSIVGGKISAAVRPSLVLNPQPMPQALVRVPVTSPRLPPARSGPQHRHIYPSPRIPLQRSPSQSPPHMQNLRSPPPHRSPKLKSPITPPVAHMVNRTPPISIRPPLQHSPFPAHSGRKFTGPRVRSPPSTQQVRPIIVNTSNNPLIRSGPVLTIPGTPQRIQATLTGIPIQTSQVKLTSPNGPMVITHTKQSPKRAPGTQLSPSNARPVIFANRQLLPANFDGHTLSYPMSKQKVLVAVNPHGLSKNTAVKIQAKPSTSMVHTGPVRGSVAPMVVSNQQQILVPIQTSPVKKPYTGKKRGRKPGSKNKPKLGHSLKVRIRPTTIVHGVTQKVMSLEGMKNVTVPMPTSVASVSQEAPSKTTDEQAKSQDEGPSPMNLAVKQTDKEKPTTEIPRAIVKPQILTHVIDGFIIEESKDPFPVSTIFA